MDKYKYLIIGGGAAGTSAAETIRTNDKEGSIAVISDEPHPLYSRVMLSKPNFFLGKIPFDKIFLKGEAWYSDNNINFLGGKKAIKLDSESKKLTLEDGSSIQYEKLLIATGVDAKRWPLNGADKKGIHYLRTLEDGKGIMEGIKTAKNAVTIGGGFISFEMADLMHLAGLKTTSIIINSYFWEPILDEASGKMLEDAMTKAGIVIMRNSDVTEIIGEDAVSGVNVKTGDSEVKLLCEMIICGIGITNPIKWLNEAGIITNYGVIANEFMETNLQDIWTAGDITEYKDLILEEHIEMGNWVSAHEQGRIAGLNMVVSANGKTDSDKINTKQHFNFVSFYTTFGFGVNIAFVGDVNVDPKRIIVPRGSPEINSYGRLIIDDKGELIGATLINRAKEMNIIAKIIEKNIKVIDKQKELGDIEFDLKKLLE